MKKSNFRWLILTLLFAATVILYIDRSALGILAPELQKTIGWNEKQYGLINSIFMVAYAICFLLMGPIIDLLGTKRGYLISIIIWSVSAITQIFARSWIGFAVARFSLAIGQSGNFPAAIKAVAEWFPKKERAFAISVFNGGANVGTILTPLIVPFVVLMFNNWQIGFLCTFPLSMLWIFFWLKHYKNPSLHQRVSSSELEYINSDHEEQKEEKVTLQKIIKYKGAWIIAIGKFIGDPIWWFYLFWGAKFLYSRFGVNLKEIGFPFFLIYLASWGIGMLLGWLSSIFLKKGFGLNKGRKLALLICALFAVPVVFVPHLDNMWLAIGLIALAAGGHCGWSANIFSLMSDIFPKKAVATVAGFGGFSGGVGGAIATFGIGSILQNIGIDGYVIPFLIAGTGYLAALLIIHLLVPKIKTIEI